MDMVSMSVRRLLLLGRTALAAVRMYKSSIEGLQSAKKERDDVQKKDLQQSAGWFLFESGNACNAYDEDDNRQEQCAHEERLPLGPELLLLLCLIHL